MTVNPNKTVIFMGERRWPTWPESIPSAPHALKVQLETRAGASGETRTVLKFGEGVTGHEEFELTEDLRERLKTAGPERGWDICFGGNGWDRLTVNMAKVQAALLELEGPAATWIAQVSFPNEDGTRRHETLVDRDGVLAGADLTAAERHFETLVGLDPDRDLVKGLFDKTPRPRVSDVFCVDDPDRLPPNFRVAREEGAAARHAGMETWRAGMLAERSAVANAVETKRMGVLKGTFDTWFARSGKKGSDPAVELWMTTEAGSSEKLAVYGQDLVAAVKRLKRDDQIELGVSKVMDMGRYRIAHVAVRATEKTKTRENAEAR